MKILTILGTRPQYIKFKPLYDYFKENKIDSVVADTDQHHDYNSSGIFLKQLELEIDYHLAINNDNQFTFLSDAMWKLADFIGDQNLYLTASVTDKPKDLKKTVADIYNELTKILLKAEMQIVHERLFGNISIKEEITNARQQVMDAAGIKDDLSLTYIEGKPCWGVGLS